MEAKSIGGYFELELPYGNALYFGDDYIELNSARNCLEYLLKFEKFTKIYIPYYTCDAVLEPIKKLEISYEFYDIDDNLEPTFDYKTLKESDVFLYTNYFGVKDLFIKSKLRSVSKNMIIDNAQAFFSEPVDPFETFYSPRKFVGVSDGGILYSRKKFQENLKKDESIERMSHLLKRIEASAEEGYRDFCENDNGLKNQPIKIMSNLTQRILCGIDYQTIKIKRRENFEFLHKHLKDKNLFKMELDPDTVPLIYPFRTKDSNLKNKLLCEKVYCATYWPNVKEWCDETKNSYNLVDEILAIPLDQRYSHKEMKRILNIIE